MFWRIGTMSFVCAMVIFGGVNRCRGEDRIQQRSVPDSLTVQLDRLSEIATTRSGDRAKLDRVIQALRLHRQRAVDRLIGDRNRIAADRGKGNGRALRIWDYAIDHVSGQKSATRSRLFWYTSIEDARRASVSSGRPLLSLRLLGRLDEELSCANSRFFRDLLYPDSQIGDVLRNKFILHWQSVRDVPIVTIEFGDHQKLRQPLVGNSVHLVLDSQGRPFDAMPGLVSPDQFRLWLTTVDQFWKRIAPENEQEFWEQVSLYHGERATIRRSESPMAIGMNQNVSELNPLDRRWQELAMRGLQNIADQRPRQKLAIAEKAMVTAVTKSAVEIPVMRMVGAFELNLSRDTVFNLYALQTKIDDWFAAMRSPLSYQQLTNRIYADVFLMPLDDPWLGLSPESAYTALDSGGRIESMVYNDAP